MEVGVPRIVNLSLVMTDNMPAHKLFQSPVILPALSHEQTKDFGLGIAEDRMTFATNYLGMLDRLQMVAGRNRETDLVHAAAAFEAARPWAHVVPNPRTEP